MYLLFYTRKMSFTVSLKILETYFQKILICSIIFPLTMIMYAFWFEQSIRRGTFCWKHPPDQWFQIYSNWKIFKTIGNQRNAFLFLAVSYNQCPQLLTDFARSQHTSASLAEIHFSKIFETVPLIHLNKFKNITRIEFLFIEAKWCII